MTGFAAICGALLFGGLIVVAFGFTRPPVPAPSTVLSTGLWKRWTAGRALANKRRWLPRIILGLAVGTVLALLTGWPLMFAVGLAAVLGLPVLLGDPPRREAELLEALDRWVRSLIATIPTGRSITDSMRVTRRQAPAVLVPRLQSLVLRLDERWSARQALLAMADELDSPVADSVLAALALAAERGGTGAVATLTALADSIQDRLKALREIETERAKPRIVVRQVTVITGTVMLVAMLVGRGFFAPYGTPVGQLILAGLLAVYVLSLVMLRARTLPRRRDRILRRAAL